MCENQLPSENIKSYEKTVCVGDFFGAQEAWERKIRYRQKQKNAGRGTHGDAGCTMGGQSIVSIL